MIICHNKKYIMGPSGFTWNWNQVLKALSDWVLFNLFLLLAFVRQLNRVETYRQKYSYETHRSESFARVFSALSIHLSARRTLSRTQSDLLRIREGSACNIYDPLVVSAAISLTSEMEVVGMYVRTWWCIERYCASASKPLFGYILLAVKS